MRDEAVRIALGRLLAGAPDEEVLAALAYVRRAHGERVTFPEWLAGLLEELGHAPEAARARAAAMLAEGPPDLRAELD